MFFLYFNTYRQHGAFSNTSYSFRQEPVIERLRREKQLATKQNAILRRQIKVLASRERRARLDAQNLKNQVFRMYVFKGYQLCITIMIFNVKVSK